MFVFFFSYHCVQLYGWIFNAFMELPPSQKNETRRYKYLVLGREGPYFVTEYSDSKNKYTEEDIIKMLECLVDKICMVFAGKVFQQIIGINMGTNCDPLLADIFLYSYEAEFIKSLLSAGKKRLESQFHRRTQEEVWPTVGITRHRHYWRVLRRSCPSTDTESTFLQVCRENAPF